MGARAGALGDLLKRYARVFGHAWRLRQALDGPERRPLEAQFLPAALALQETPVHPAPRVAMWLIVTFAAIALVWALLGRIDIVATAQGKIIPDDRTKVIHPMEQAVVKAIHVRDGQAVEAGDILIELDATAAQADAVRIRRDLLTATLEMVRVRAFLAAMDSPLARPMLSLPLEEVAEERVAAEQRLLEGQLGEFQAKLEQLDAEVARREAELRVTGEIARKLEQTLPIARQRWEDFERLLEKNFVSRYDTLERKQAFIEQQQDLAAQWAKLAEVGAALEETLKQKATLTAETKRLMLDRLHEAEEKAAALSQERVKAEQRDKLMKLAAPVNGIVQQLAVYTVGGVVTPAQPLLVIVPRGKELVIEAFVENKDIGFVDAGQEAEIKIETFAFTKYGTLPGKVIQVSWDAIQDERRGLIYAARVTLDSDTIQVEGKGVKLSPGMAATVEIKTGKRRLIEYFLSPFLQYAHDSLRER